MPNQNKPGLVWYQGKQYPFVEAYEIETGRHKGKMRIAIKGVMRMIERKYIVRFPLLEKEGGEGKTK